MVLLVVLDGRRSVYLLCKANTLLSHGVAVSPWLQLEEGGDLRLERTKSINEDSHLLAQSCFLEVALALAPAPAALSRLELALMLGDHYFLQVAHTLSQFLCTVLDTAQLVAELLLSSLH